MTYQIDHLVMTVQDLEKTCRFYETALGIPTVTFGNGRKALQLGHQKINLHWARSPLSPHAQQPTVGSVDLCLLTDTPVQHLQDTLTALGIAIADGPVQRTGATGPILSIYVHDPDGNLIELANALEMPDHSVEGGIGDLP